MGRGIGHLMPNKGAVRWCLTFSSSDLMDREWYTCTLSISSAKINVFERLHPGNETHGNPETGPWKRFSGFNTKYMAILGIYVEHLERNIFFDDQKTTVTFVTVWSMVPSTNYSGIDFCSGTLGFERFIWIFILLSQQKS